MSELSLFPILMSFWTFSLVLVFKIKTDVLAEAKFIFEEKLMVIFGETPTFSNEAFFEFFPSIFMVLT
jgi:hypothetical protein